MREAEGVRLQKFRLLQIQKVASNLQDLRHNRDDHKKEFKMHATKLSQLNKNIKQLKEIFDRMQRDTGISIPNIVEEKQIQKRGSFFDQAEDKFNENLFIKEGQKQLQKINQEVQKDYQREKEYDFLDKSEHIMRVDQFMKNDLKLEEDK